MSELTPVGLDFPVEFELYAPVEFDEGPVLIDGETYDAIIEGSNPCL